METEGKGRKIYRKRMGKWKKGKKNIMDNNEIYKKRKRDNMRNKNEKWKKREEQKI